MKLQKQTIGAIGLVLTSAVLIMAVSFLVAFSSHKGQCSWKGNLQYECFALSCSFTCAAFGTCKHLFGKCSKEFCFHISVNSCDTWRYWFSCFSGVPLLWASLWPFLCVSPAHPCQAESSGAGLSAPGGGSFICMQKLHPVGYSALKTTWFFQFTCNQKYLWM